MSRVDSLEAQSNRIRDAILARHGLQPGERIPAQLHGAAIEEAQRHSSVTAHWGIASDAPVVGSLLVLFRRVLRIMLRWYINPIVDQQNRFNQAAVRALYELRAENESLRAELQRYVEASKRHRP